jgi:signal transduction histidine kinase
MKSHLIIVLIFIVLIPVWILSMVWNDSIQEDNNLRQCQYEKTFYIKELGGPLEIETLDHVYTPNLLLKNLGLIGLSFAIFIFGSYFSWEYLRVLGSTTQKVSFVNQVSHELKTPLTNIRMYIDLLKPSLSEEESSLKKLEIIEQESGRLERLINNVLAFSYSGEHPLDPKEHDTEQVISEVVDGFRPQFEEKNIDIVLNGRAGTAFFDRGILEQILVNLISNVGKYAESATMMEIKSWKDDGRLYIVVRDDGPGIDETVSKEMFKPFVRGDNKNTTGFGIGLPLSLNLAQAHKGSLRLLETDKGASFEVIL